MSVSAISSSDNQYSMSIQAAATQRRQDVQALANALKSGDLASAQSAFASLQNLPGGSTSQAQNVPAAGQPSAASSNFQALAGALQSGDLAGAQAAFAALQKGHHGHHHHHAQSAASTPGTDSTSNAVDPNQLLGTTLSVKA